MTQTTDVPQVSIERLFDAVVLNAVVNDESVYPWVRGPVEGPLDLTAIVSDRSNVLLGGEFGSALFMPSGPGLWELHTQVLPAGRGAWTLGFGRSALLWMFTRTDVMEVLTRVPEGNVAAAAAARKMGFSPKWSMVDGWMFDGKVVGVKVWSLTLQDWLAGPWATGLDSEADRFAAAVSDDPAAPPIRADARRPLGFALAAIRGGQALKGCAMLNRWAAFSQFPLTFVASTEPLTIALGGALFRVAESGSLVDSATLH